MASTQRLSQVSRAFIGGSIRGTRLAEFTGHRLMSFRGHREQVSTLIIREQRRPLTHSEIHMNVMLPHGNLRSRCYVMSVSVPVLCRFSSGKDPNQTQNRNLQYLLVRVVGSWSLSCSVLPLKNGCTGNRTGGSNPSSSVASYYKYCV